MTIKSSSLEKKRAQITLCDHSNIRYQNIASIASYKDKDKDKDNFCPSKNIVPQRTSSRLLWMPGIVFGLFSICGHSTVKPNRIADESETNIKFSGEFLDLPPDKIMKNCDDIKICRVDNPSHNKPNLFGKREYKRELNMSTFIEKNALPGKILVFVLADSRGYEQSYEPVLDLLDFAVSAVKNKCPVALVISGNLQGIGRPSLVPFSSTATKDWLRKLRDMFHGNVFVSFGDLDIVSNYFSTGECAPNEYFYSFLNNCHKDNINILFNLKQGLQNKFRRDNIHHGCILGNTLFFPYSMKLYTYQVNSIFERDYSTALLNFDLSIRKKWPDQLLRDFGKAYKSKYSYRPPRRTLYCSGLSYLSRIKLSDSKDETPVVSSIQNEYTPWEVNGSPNRAALDTAYLLKLFLEDLARKNPTGTLNVVFAAHDHHIKVLVFLEGVTELLPSVRVSPEILKRLCFGLACGGNGDNLSAVKEYAYMTASDGTRCAIPCKTVAQSMYNDYICGFALDHTGSGDAELLSKDDELAKFTREQEDTTKPEYLPKLLKSVSMTAKVALRKHTNKLDYDSDLLEPRHEHWDCESLERIARHLKEGKSFKEATQDVDSGANKKLFDLVNTFFSAPSKFNPRDVSCFDILRQHNYSKYGDLPGCSFEYCAKYPVFFWFIVFSELCKAIDHSPDAFREYRQNLACFIRSCIDEANVLLGGSDKYIPALVRSIHCMQSDAGCPPPEALAPLWRLVAWAKERVQKTNGEPVVDKNISELERIVLKCCTKIYKKQQELANEK
ncbi:MAG: hypothetical protein LBR89_01340 [Holosporales bacterium]|jgi:hypothetical protein|nr:hypothetical protein [Holosporales bacterium]